MAILMALSPSFSTNYFNQPRPTATMTLKAEWGVNWESVQWNIFASRTTPGPTSANHEIWWRHDWWRIGIGDTHVLAVSFPSLRASLTPGTWYARYEINNSPDDEWAFGGATGQSTFNYTFTVAIKPSVTTLTPTPLPIIATTSAPVFTWQYNTSDPQYDYQTAYRLEVWSGTSGNTFNSTLLHDSGKVAATWNAASLTVNPAISSQNLWWRVRVWDKNDTPSDYSALQNFNMVDPPTITIASPTQNQVVNNGSPSVTLQPTIYEGGTAATIKVSAWTGGSEVWRKTLTGSYSTGSSVVITDNEFAFANNTLYTYQASVVDNRGLASGTTSRNFTTSFTLPATPSGTVAANVNTHASSGYVSVTWSGSVRDTDFLAWQVERRDALINPATGVASSFGGWEVLGRSYATTTSVEFRDYLAPIGYKSEYRIRQVALRFGTELISNNGITIQSDYLGDLVYWLVGGQNGSSDSAVAIRLYNVTDDSYTDEDERAEFNLMGRGRYVEKGDRLGVRGQLTLKLRNSDGVMARQKRELLVNFKRAYNTAWLKNPFGDVYPVNVGDMAIQRLSGVGYEEFCDVTVPYVEVIS